MLEAISSDAKHWTIPNNGKDLYHYLYQSRGYLSDTCYAWKYCLIEPVIKNSKNEYKMLRDQR